MPSSFAGHGLARMEVSVVERENAGRLFPFGAVLAIVERDQVRRFVPHPFIDNWVHPQLGRLRILDVKGYATAFAHTQQKLVG